MTINIITPNGSGDSLVYTCPRTAIAAEVTGSEVSSGEGKLEFKTTTSGTSATKMTIDGAGAVTLATPLPLASGGTGAVSVNGLVQVVNVQDGAVATGTTTIPNDDTIPQITEGDEFMTLAITPTSATNKLKIEVYVVIARSVADWVAACLFQDSTANALAGVNEYQTTTNTPVVLSFQHYMTAGTTSATTFRVRGGGHYSGTATFNGWGGNRKWGGVYSSSITITEISV
jgi:hypothetical protein